ncbi:MAG TPA: hypothetical protein VN081_03380 [Dongiaceae bacterium]|nr:hypothetical protein [Dongiaceae bacterium]
MSDFIISIIRTYVPILVGGLAAWLSLKGISLDSSTILALGTGLGGVFAALYYAVVRLLEKKFPQLGILIGSPKQPNYPTSK